MNTPWGPSDHASPIAPGIVFYSTPSHGGLHLSPERWDELIQRFPQFKPLAGPPWLEENSDYMRAVLLWPQYWDDYACYLVRGRARQYRRALADVPRVYWLSCSWREIVTRARDWADTHQGHWIRGAMGTAERGRWWVSLIRVGDCERRTMLVSEYPSQRYYSHRELATAIGRLEAEDLTTTWA